jgi:hypothetical protein
MLVELGVVPPRGDAIPSVPIRADKIIILILWSHVPFPGRLLCIFRQFFDLMI